MSTPTKNKAKVASHDAVSQLFGQIGELLNTPAALKSPEILTKELQKPLKVLQVISTHEFEAVQTVVRALSAEINKLAPAVAREQNQIDVLHLMGELQTVTEDDLSMHIVENPISVDEAFPDYVRALEEDSRVRDILDNARQRKAGPMSTDESVREGTALLAAMRAKSAATLLGRIENKELISSRELQERLGIRRQSISDAVKSGRLFALVGPSGENYYPAFYADERLDRRAIEKVSKALGSLPAASKYFFFTSKLSTLQETPLQALAKGRLEEVLVAASSFAVS